MGKIKDQLPESLPTPESLGFEPVGQIIEETPLVGCPACGGSGGGEVGGTYVECSECDGGLVTVAEYGAIAKRYGWEG